MIIALIVVYWIASSILSYYLGRRDYVRSEYLEWDNFSRSLTLVMAILFGAYYWAIILIGNGVLKLADSDWAKREAKW